MRLRVSHPWASPYGEASWLGCPVIYDGRIVGKVVDEEGGDKRTARLTIELNSDEAWRWSGLDEDSVELTTINLLKLELTG